jgi:hypothetical protein
MQKTTEVWVLGLKFLRLELSALGRLEFESLFVLLVEYSVLECLWLVASMLERLEFAAWLRLWLVALALECLLFVV